MSTSIRVFYAPWPSEIWNRGRSRVHVRFRRADRLRGRSKGPPAHEIVLEPGWCWYPGVDGFPPRYDETEWEGPDVWIV
jgi:hypothetical protein